MGRKIFGLLLIIIFLFQLQSPNALSKGDEQNWKKINELADHVLQLGKQKKYEEAKKIIQNFSSLFLKKASEKELTMEEMKMVIYSYEQAEAALSSLDMDEKDRLNNLLQFRLTVNSVTNKHQPLWRETERFVLEPLEKSIKAIKEEERNQFQMYLNEFFASYEVIRPSLIISLPKHESERYDSYIKYLENYRSKLESSPEKNKQLKEIQREFQALFQQKEQASAEPELLGLIYAIGSIIAVTLIYVGWRKYKGDKKRKQMKDLD